MDAATQPALRAQLLDRRRRLEDALAGRPTASLETLLQEVDAALERLGQGTYGVCETCHEAIEAEHLRVDPLARNCLTHLTAEQQRALEQDLDLASHIQRKLLPQQNLRHAGWEVSYHYEPAGAVSGDHCDVIPQEADGLFFALGDVSGKGIAASMLMTQMRAIFRTLVSAGLPLPRQMEQANRLFCESSLSEHYATLVAGRAGLSGEIELANAGHCRPLWIREGQVVAIEATGLPLGLFCSGEYPSTAVRMAEGDTLLLYTDGLTEAANSSDVEYGQERLLHVAAQHRSSAPQALIAACLDDLGAHLARAIRQDDLTLMAIRRTG